MPDEPNAIAPALTVEEWKRHCSADGAFVLAADGSLAINNNVDDGTDYYGDDALPKLMALANAALPDDDPRKITQADVDDEREAYHDSVIFARWAQDRGDETMRERARERARRHMHRAAKLAALLPP